MQQHFILFFFCEIENLLRWEVVICTEARTYVRVFWTEYGKRLLRLVTFLYGGCQRKPPQPSTSQRMELFNKKPPHINYSNPVHTS